MRSAPTFLAVSIVFAQAGSQTPDDRIRAVETGLKPDVVLKGRPAPRYTLEERMKALNVRGVSIAVIRDYEIEWAKGYGFADLESKRPVTAETLFQAGSITWR